MTLRVRATLAWRLVALGIAQIVVLALVFMAVGRIVNGAPPDHPHGVEPVTVYDDTGAVIASTVEPPLSPGQPELKTNPTSVGGKPGLVVTRAHGHPPHGVVTPLNTLFAGGLLIIGGCSLLTARSIVRPLRELSRVATAFGGGSLRARSGLRRTDEIGDLGRAFDEMGERIEGLLLTQKELLANVSHELRTPLARIRVALEIAGEGDPEAGRMSLSEIGVDLAELETLIDDILTTTRLEIAQGAPLAAHFELHVESLEPELVCARAAERFRARHPLRPLELIVEHRLPPVQADPVLLRRVIDNVLENAHKYSPDPTSVIALRASASSKGDGRVDFAVEDRGMGVAPEDLPRLFTPFFRADRSRTRGTGGVGLGLTLAKRIVDAHRGDIRVASAAGAGTTVTASVPIAAPESAAAHGIVGETNVHGKR
jgi:signal transduction histidine kinase